MGNIRSFQPKSMPKGHSSTATVAMELSLDTKIARSNARFFAQAMERAIVASLQSANVKQVYNSQVKVVRVLSDGHAIWTRTMTGTMARRLEGAQKVTVEVTFANVDEPNAMSLKEI